MPDARMEAMTKEDRKKRDKEIIKYRKTGECLCTFSQKVVGDGCYLCNPYDVQEHLADHRDDLEIEVEEKDTQITALKARIDELEAALRSIDTEAYYFLDGDPDSFAERISFIAAEALKSQEES